MKRNFSTYRKIAHNIHLAYYLQAAEELGCQYVMYKDVAKISYSNKFWFFSYAKTPLNNTTAVTVAKYKDITSKILQENGISVPKQTTVQTVEEAIKLFHQWKKIVVKPRKGSGGKGITVNPQNIKEVREAFKYSQQYTKGKNKYIIVEKFIPGRHYRILVLANDVIAIIERT